MRKFEKDLGWFGFRRRRMHELRRTFITLARADRGRIDVLKWITHGKSTDIMDVYTTLPWQTLCEEVAKLKLERLSCEVVPLRKVAGRERWTGPEHTAEGGRPALGAVLGAVASDEVAGKAKRPKSRGLEAFASWRGGRDSNPRPPA